MGMSSAVKVSIRVRPFNRREINADAELAIQVEGSSVTAIHHQEAKTFGYDECFWSHSKSDAHFCDQNKVFSSVGAELISHSLDGYNCCLMAYGQTGAGKSYTMMGTKKEPGLIPQIAQNIFERIETASRLDGVKSEVEVSYMEIYCEKVRDLLGKSDKPLRVREHPALGPYVEGLNKLAATTKDEALQFMATGNAARTVAATTMNATSSRSHAVFQIFIKQTQKDENENVIMDKKSKIALIDLAGSERAGTSNTSGTRLKEGGSINKSLTTLGKVIHALSEKKKHVPYRESVLTWLLKDSLGGNSRTWVCAAVSPSSDCIEETISTLRWADRARKVQCHAVVNEDPTAKLISSLRSEIEQLKKMMDEPKVEDSLPQVVDQLNENERLVVELETDWNDKVQCTKEFITEKVVELEGLGVLHAANPTGISAPKQPHLVNLSPDPALSECLLYIIGTESDTIIGSDDSSTIKLMGEGVNEVHAKFTQTGSKLTPNNDECKIYVNGKEVPTEGIDLKHGDRLIFGKAHVFRYSSGTGQTLADSFREDMASMIDGETDDIDFDWDQAQKELLNGAGIDMAKEMECKLLTVAEEAYRREKQKAEVGAQDPAETSWKLIKGLRERLQPGQVQSIVKKAGVIKNDDKSGNDSQSQAAEMSWVTMSDVKLQAVKELCYEVALGDFDMAQSELEELSRRITSQVTQRWGKSDPCFEESWRSVLRDAAETIGLEVNETELNKGLHVTDSKENNRLKAKLDEVSRREQIKDMELAQLRAKVTAQETGTYTSHKYIRGKEFDQPSPGVIVPGHLDDEERIEWLMENDPAFKRGRLRWEKTQKKHQDNLKQREVNKEKRKLTVNKTPTRHFEPLKDEPTTPGVTFSQEVEVKTISARRSKSARRRHESPPPPQSPSIGLRSDYPSGDPFDPNNTRSNGRRTFRQSKSQTRSQNRRRPKSQSAPTNRDVESDRRVMYNDRGREQLQRQVSTGSNKKSGGSKLEQYRNRSGVGGASDGVKNGAFNEDTKSPPLLDNRNYDQAKRRDSKPNNNNRRSNNNQGGNQSNQRRAKSRNRNNQNHDFNEEREVVVRGDQRVESPRFKNQDRGDNRRGARPMYQPPHRRGSEKE